LKGLVHPADDKSLGVGVYGDHRSPIVVYLHPDRPCVSPVEQVFNHGPRAAIDVREYPFGLDELVQLI
jgi:hypothetical protein